MSTLLIDAPPVPLLAGDQWWSPVGVEHQPVFNPSHGEVIARVPLGRQPEVDRAVQAAATAFPAWSKTPAPARAARLFAFKARRCSARQTAISSGSVSGGKSLVRCSLPTLM